VDQVAYVKANETVFDQLPVFLGARFREQSSAPYHSGEDGGGPVAGYTTLFLFGLPHEAPADDVAAFFRRRLQPQWRLVERLDGPVLNFRKGRSFVSINLEGWRSHVLEIAVDHSD
jgi:hypothetical protein